MTVPPRWITDHPSTHPQWYVDRLRKMAVDGVDLVGEARLVDVLVPVRSRILDAGCGPGRVGAELFRRGHDVVGVDVDPVLLDAAREDHPGPLWLQGDLSELDLPAAGVDEPFDAVVLAGNVLPYLAPGTEPEVLRRVVAHLRPDGVVVAGFGLDRGYSLAEFDAHCAAAGLVFEHRFGTWDLRPWHIGGDYAVTVLRRAG